MSDLEMPSCCHATKPRARKRHRCCECGGWIEIWETYHRLDGIWDGRASGYKTCEQCQALRDEMQARPRSEPIGLGMLYEEVSESDDVRAFTRVMAIGHRRGVPPRENDCRWLREVCGRPAIKCAAILYEGATHEGWSHAWIGAKMVYEGTCPRPFPGGPAQGFTTTEGVFVGREEALAIALACHQVIPGKHQHPSELFSEDLRYDKK